MHPSRAFAWEDRDEMLAFLARVSFSAIVAIGDEGPAVAHTPVLVAGPDRLLFHISKSNRALAALEGGTAILSCVGPHAYVSPDWYGSDDQVPTWNYLAVECEGPLRRLEPDALPGLLDGLSAVQEGLLPKTPWTRDKMSAGRFEGLLKAIVGFEMRIDSIRGTRKLGQNKQPEERIGAADALAALGAGEMASLMRSAA